MEISPVPVESEPEAEPIRSPMQLAIKGARVASRILVVIAVLLLVVAALSAWAQWTVFDQQNYGIAKNVGLMRWSQALSSMTYSGLPYAGLVLAAAHLLKVYAAASEARFVHTAPQPAAVPPAHTLMMPAAPTVTSPTPFAPPTAPRVTTTPTSVVDDSAWRPPTS